jgi:hypothetical protein
MPLSIATTTVTSSSLAPNATDSTKTIALGMAGILLSLTGDPVTDCRFTLYATVVAQTADAGRAFGTPYAAGTPILLDEIIGANAVLSIMDNYASLEAVPLTALPVSIANVGLATAPITVTARFTDITANVSSSDNYYCGFL